MSTSVDSHRGAGPPGDDGESDDVTSPLRRPEPEDTSTERFPAPVREDVPDEAPPAASAPARPRRRSRGLRVPTPASVAPVPDDEAAGSGAEAAVTAADTTTVTAAPAPAVSPGPTPRPRPTPKPRPAAAPAAGAPPTGGPPVGGPPPSTVAKEPPKKHTAALGRLALVLVLVAAVVGTVVVLQQRSQFGRTDAGPEEIPALEVAPAQVDLNTVGQPNAIAPPSALLPGTATAPQPGRAPTISAWANGLASKTNVPAVALQAYGMADLSMRQIDKGCNLSWVTIAGLARIESNHGRYRGAQVLPSGDVTPRIIGVPLDGTSGNRTITDTDGGALDGDRTLDRAVGPLQFIPSTWARWRSDGNNDGRADPNNIFDVALAAGRYLCAGGRDLATGEGWRSAVLSYNYSDEYGRRVYAAAQAYANSTTP